MHPIKIMVGNTMLIFASVLLILSSCSKKESQHPSGILKETKNSIPQTTSSLNRNKRGPIEPICTTTYKQALATAIASVTHEEFHAKHRHIPSLFGHASKYSCDKSFWRHRYEGTYSLTTLTTPQIIGKSYRKSTPEDAIRYAIADYWRQVADLKTIGCDDLEKIYDQIYALSIYMNGSSIMINHK